ncbi:---NA--- : : EF-hand_7 [Gemmataceae bacterium]|nr:---NA--- : : EF-hand_7 [Gemmataceae bacterium]VTU01436.1 ---NA--- : : EF-hand_7 [Gemmataceae bacterium]
MRKRALSALGVATLSLVSATAAPPANNNHQLDAQFAKADKNKDGFLDAEELAKEFRGPNAKVIADKLGTKGEAHPDHQFMDKWDENKDGKISKAEFERYETKTLADARASANRNKNYTRAGRAGYRAPQRHRGYAGRGYGTNPYTATLRSQQRAYQQQRQAYVNLMRFGVYSPNIRGGYRGVQRHNHNGRRR